MKIILVIFKKKLGKNILNNKKFIKIINFTKQNSRKNKST